MGDAEGSITIGGKEIRVKGRGIFEHVIAEYNAWMEIGWQDWIWFVFNDMYGLVYEVHTAGYKDGAIYLVKEKEYLIIRDFDIDHPQWAFSPVLQHHFPIRVQARASTDKGVLLTEWDVVRSQTWGQVNKYRPIVTMAASDMDVR